MKYTIAFDFPEAVEPVFCGATRDGLGFSTTLAGATKFDNEATAQRVLDNGYSAEARASGVVVEVGR